MEYRILKRSLNNSTHNSLIDTHIKHVECYRSIPTRYYISLFLYIVTFGIFLVIVNNFPKIYINLVLERISNVYQANYLVVTDTSNEIYLLKPTFENFFQFNPLLNYLISSHLKNNKILLEKSEYIGEDYYNISALCCVFTFEKNKYIFVEGENLFHPVYFDITRYSHDEIYNYFFHGIRSTLEYNYLLNKFGRNTTSNYQNTFAYILLHNLIKPFNLYQILTCIIWISSDYWEFAIVVLSILSITILIDSRKSYTNSQRGQDLVGETNCKIKRNLIVKENVINVQKKIPGDVIFITEGMIMPCDAILLDGICTVNESEITGESNLEMKTPLPRSNENFLFAINGQSLLSQGTKIIKSEPLDYSLPCALVVNTGFNTIKGDLIQKSVEINKTTFFMGKDMIKFFLTMFIVCLSGLILLIIFNSEKDVSTKTTAFEKYHSLKWKILNIFTFLIPPTLPISLNFSSFYFNRHLNKRDIHISDSPRLNAAGRVNVIVFDKTGTLTEENIKLIGFQTTFTKTYKYYNSLDKETETESKSSSSSHSTNSIIDEVSEDRLEEKEVDNYDSILSEENCNRNRPNKLKKDAVINIYNENKNNFKVLQENIINEQDNKLTMENMYNYSSSVENESHRKNIHASPSIQDVIINHNNKPNNEISFNVNNLSNNTKNNNNTRFNNQISVNKSNTNASIDDNNIELVNVKNKSFGINDLSGNVLVEEMSSRLIDNNNHTKSSNLNSNINIINNYYSPEFYDINNEYKDVNKNNNNNNNDNNNNNIEDFPVSRNNEDKFYLNTFQNHIDKNNKNNYLDTNINTYNNIYNTVNNNNVSNPLLKQIKKSTYSNNKKDHSTSLKKISRNLIDNNLLELDEIENVGVIYGGIHKEFWKRYYQNKNNPHIQHDMLIDQGFNIVFFMECLATCNSLRNLHDSILGNAIDKMIMDTFDWEFREVRSQVDPTRIYFELTPPYSYKITDISKFSDERTKFKLTVVKRFDFSSRYQCNSVITYNSISRRFCFFIKGAPERIIKICKPQSFPAKFHENLFDHTNEGHRVLACGFKFLDEKDLSILFKDTIAEEKYFMMNTLNHTKWNNENNDNIENNENKDNKEIENELDENNNESKKCYKESKFKASLRMSLSRYNNNQNRELFEKDLNFLGLVLFKNNLKSESKHTITRLQESHMKVIMCTGDSPFTSLYVAKECEMISKDTLIYLFEIERITKKDKSRDSKSKPSTTINNLQSGVDLSLSNSVEEVIRITTNEFDLEKDYFIKISDNMDESNFSENKNTNSNTNTHHKEEELNKNNKVDGYDNFNNIENPDNSARGLNNDSHYMNDKDHTNKTNFRDRKETTKKSNTNYNFKYYQKRKKTKEIQFLDINDIIEQDKNCTFAISGETLELIMKIYKKRKSNISLLSLSKDAYIKLIKIIINKSQIFYRMSPNNKVELINLLKEIDRNNIVAMCGDGANDCGALLYADIGVLLNKHDILLTTTHFFCPTTAVSSVETIIKSGRASFENSSILFKYMLLYAILKNSTTIILYPENIDFTSSQQFFIDLFIILFSSFLSSKTPASENIIVDKPHHSIFHINFLISVIGQSVINCLFLSIFYYFGIKKRVDVSEKYSSDSPTIHASYLFLLSCFQYFFLGFIFNFMSLNRKRITQNKSYMFYCCLLLFFLISMCTINVYNTSKPYTSLIKLFPDIRSSEDYNYQILRIITVGVIIGNFLLSFGFEYLLYLFIYRSSKPTSITDFKNNGRSYTNKF